MKKTLSIALIAAMTISMASMTAFAKEVTYSNENLGVEIPEEVVATVTLKKSDMKATKILKGYKAKKAISQGAVNVAKDDTVTLDQYKDLGDAQADCEPEYDDGYEISFDDLGLKKYDNTATKTFYGWIEGDVNDWTTNGEAPASKDKVLKNSNYKIAVTAGAFDANGKLTKQYATVGRTDTDDETIAKNLKAIEDAKNNGDAAKTEEDRLAELDKKYNADGKNAYDAEKKDVKGEFDKTRKQWTADNMNDYFHHAAKVAGAPAGKDDDGTKTWVYDISMKNGQKLYDGKNQRVSIELDGVSKDADLSKFGVKVFHIEGWCKATKVKNVDVKGNKVTFWVNDFSPYVITLGDGVASTGAADASNPSTGDFSAVPVALLAAAALGATGFVAYKKRKAE